METIIIFVFILGYAAIAFEHPIKVNKAASALLTGVICWTVYILLGSETEKISNELVEHLGNLSGILFFLMGAMTIVELVDAHNGFEVITNLITTTDKRKLLWIVSIITFFLSAVLDNLTTSIVMVTLLRSILSEKKDRMFFLGMIVIAANAGGAWSPIGDVTTTMLWIGGQITSSNIIMKLFVPSVFCLLMPLVVVSFFVKGHAKKPVNLKEEMHTLGFEKKLVFFLGIGALVFTPVFKSITHLPPFMGILFGLGVLWVVTEIIHKTKEEKLRKGYSVAGALQRIDVTTILFFLGILVAISSLESTGQLDKLAVLMNNKIGNQSIIVICIGILSSIVDNVPLVAATMGMYDLHTFPADDYLWEFIAYCAGTGGSLLIIGSAAGVAVMGMEKVDFIWYLKKISWIAATGYFAGALAYMSQHYFLHM